LTVTPVAPGSRLWTRGAPSPKARLELGAAALAGRVFAIGGADARFRPLADVFVYDPAIDRWSAAAPLPEPRHHLGIAELDGKIYAVGGYADAAPRQDSWVYDPAVDAWSAIAALPRSQAAHALVALEGKLYLVGGNSAIAGVPQPMYVYEPAADRWDAARAPLPTAREHLAAVAAGGQLFAIGGRVGPGLNLATVEIYDPAADRWTKGPDLPTATSGMTAGWLGDEIHVVGGEDLSDFSIVTAHQVLDLKTMTWSEWARPPVSRHGLGSAVVDGRWFVINGGPTADVSVSNWVDILTP
jgi:N-acetylneuraminic acid mutarotase